MESPLGTIIIYARNMKKSADFYARHFGFITTGEVSEGLIELRAPKAGAGILIHQAAKSVKLGQVGVKLVFHVKDVAAFVTEAAERGLKFGAIHDGQRLFIRQRQGPGQEFGECFKPGASLVPAAIKMPNINIATPYGEISMVNEPAYTFGSADNVRKYPFAKLLTPGTRPVSVHGLLLNGQPLAVFGAVGGATGVHEHSALWLNDRLLLAVCGSVISVHLEPFELCWVLRVDDATCFGIHFHQPSGSLLSHGELSITRFTGDGTIVWQSGGHDIFTGSMVLHDDFASVEDLDDHRHNFGYRDGKERSLAHSVSGPPTREPHAVADSNSLAKSFFRFDQRKLTKTLAFVVAMSALIWMAGQFWILHSEPYELARTMIASRLNVKPEQVQLKRLASFQFSDGEFSGRALFVLCVVDGRCFTVIAKKRDGRWSMTDLVER